MKDQEVFSDKHGFNRLRWRSRAQGLVQIKVRGRKSAGMSKEVGAVPGRGNGNRTEKSQELGCEALAISLCLTLYEMGKQQQYLRENDIIKFAFYLPVLNEKETQQN